MRAIAKVVKFMFRTFLLLIFLIGLMAVINITLTIIALHATGDPGTMTT